MKITSGYAQGMKLSIAAGQITRPTSEKVRQAVMNMISGYLDGSFFYDLFSGTGAMGLEAISRGAKGCLFVESEPKALCALRANITELQRRYSKQNLEIPKILVSAQPVENLKSVENMANIIWADPPYEDSLDYLQKINTRLSNFSQDEALLIWEWDKASLKRDDKFWENLGLGTWEFIKQKEYGRTVITMWQKKDRLDQT